VTARRAWWALAALVVVSTGLRAWAGLKVPVPWIAPDEMVYALLGRGLWEHGSLDILGGPTPYYSFLTPLFAGFPLAAFGLDSGYDVLKVLQALAMSLAAVPVFLWARTLVPARSALLAAALAVAVPGLAYSGLVMTEVLFYPLLVLAAWAAAEALVRRTWQAQLLAVAAFLAVAGTRLQAIVLLPAYATAVGLDAGMARSWAGLRKLWPAVAGFGGLALAWLSWQLASGGATLGGYQVVADSSYSVGGAAKYIVYHLADLLILCGVLPALGVAALVVRALRRGEPDPRVRAYLAIASSLAVWFVLEVGIFASRYSDRLVERNLMALAPVLFVGLALWLERGAPHDYVVAGVAAAVLLVLPVRRLVTMSTTHDAMTTIPLYRLAQWTSGGTMRIVYMVAAVLLVAAFAFGRGRLLRAMPVVLLAGGILASVVASRFVVHEARAQQRTFLGDDPSWANHAVPDKRFLYLYDGEPSWPGVWESVFWNDNIDRVYDLGTLVPGPLPQGAATVGDDGRLHFAGGKAPKFAIASTWIELDGERKGQVAQQGLTQAGLVLWHMADVPRLLSQTSGLQVNGDIYGPDKGRIDAYDCVGSFRYSLVIKEDQAVDIFLDGKLVRHLVLKAGDTWNSSIPVSRPGRKCTFEIAPTHLVGTTELTFHRGS
jgi:hypothetical protein